MLYKITGKECWKQFMAKTVKIGPYSAYAIAVAAGYQGTEQEWLESLVGPQGAQGASITAAKIDENGHLIFTVHDPKTGTDTTIDAGSIDTTDAAQTVLQQIQQAGQDAVASVSQSVQQAANSAAQAAQSATDAQGSATSAAASEESAAASAAVVSANASNLQTVVDNLPAIKGAPAAAQSAAKSAEDAKTAAQQALGFRTLFSAVSPDENGDLDPSRPMTTPSAQASWTIESKGDRIQSVQVNGFTQQAGTGDASPENVREITVAAQDGTLPITLTGGQTVTENFKLTAPLCDGDKVKSCVPSGCDKTITVDGSAVAVTASGSDYVVTASDASANGNVYSEELAYLSLTDGQIVIPASSLPYGVTGVQAVNSWLQSNPQKMWYQSTAYTEQNDIPVQLETHNNGFVVLDGTQSGRLQSQSSGVKRMQFSARSYGLLCKPNQAMPLLCSQAVGGPTNNDTNRVQSGSSGNLYLSLDVFQGADASTSTANQYFAAQKSEGTPVSLLYPLAAPAVYAHDPVALVAVPYTEADATAAQQLAATPSTLPYIDSADVPMLLGDTGEAGTDAAGEPTAQPMTLAAPLSTALPVAGTYVVSSQDSTTVLVSLKAMQDGGNAATLGGMTLEDIKALISSMIEAAKTQEVNNV